MMHRTKSAGQEMHTSTTSKPYTDSSSLCSVTAVPCNVIADISDLEQTDAMTVCA